MHNQTSTPTTVLVAPARFGIPAVAAAILLASAPAGAQSAVETQSKLDALRQEIAELRARRAGREEWLTAERAAEVRAIVEEVLTDASTRTSLEDSAATAGWKNGFFISSADSNWLMRVGGYMQTRFAYDARESVTGLSGTQSLDTWGFETRRLKVILEGNIIDPSWKYRVETTVQNGTVGIEATYLEKVLDGGFTLRAGQFKTPFLREFLIIDTAAMMVDRSSVEGFFTSGGCAGVQLAWRQDDVQLTGMYSNGFVVKSNYFSSGDMRNLTWGSPSVAEYAFLGRAEWKPAGDWKQFLDPAGWPSEQFGVLIGLGGQVERKDNSQGVPAAYGALQPSVVGATVDLSVEGQGASLFTYGVWRQIDPNDAAYNAAEQYGVMVQGGVFVSNTVELVARYEYGNADTRPNGEAPVVNGINNNGYETLNTVGVGANWFIQKQQIKLAWDVCCALDGIGAFANSGNGFLADGTSASGAFDQDGQVMTRLQLQIVW